MSLSQNVRVLLVEDEPNDAELIAHQLRQAGLLFSYQRVQTRDSLIAALDQFDPAIVLCDNGLPAFDAASAIRTVTEKRAGLPVVVVTGTLGDEEAVHLIKIGACDYLRKDRLERLPVAVMNALEAAQSHRIQEQYEAAVKASELRYRRRFETATDGILVADAATGRIYDVNPSLVRLLGFSREECCGQTLTEFGLIDADNILPLEALLATGDYYRRPVLQLDGKNGRQVDVEFTAVAFKVGTEVTIQCNLRDVTERTYFEAALREKNRELEAASLAKDQFLASMSHELRTPLNAILGFAGTLLMRLPGELTAEQEKQLKLVRQSGRHLLSLINDLLNLAKIESGKMELSLEPVHCERVLREVATSLSPMATAKGLDLKVIAPPTDVVVTTSQQALWQIVTNLTANAIKFTTAGEIRLELRDFVADGETQTQVLVSDTGIGIRPEDQARLFQGFSRIGDGATEHEEGTGLGLSISRKLATLIGGDLSCRSEYRVGSTFTLTLPNGGRS
jgi:PAS domain S-box-containing protein